MKTKIYSKKYLLLGGTIALFLSLLISFGLFTSAYAYEDINNAKNSSESNDGWKSWKLEPGTTLLDVQNPYETRQEKIIGNPYAGSYMFNNDNGIKGPHLVIIDDIVTNTLEVHYTPWCPGIINDVDYKYTVVAMNHEGTIEARFVASGDDYISDDPATEEIWQEDCVWGDKHIVEDPWAYNGSFYIEKIEVAD